MQEKTSVRVLEEAFRAMSIPIRMLNEIQYCERLFHLMYVQGLYEENADTVEGTAQHRRAETRRRKKDVAPEELWDTAPLSLHMEDDNLNLVGKLDTIKLEDETWAPVESKHSVAPENSSTFKVADFELCGKAWPNDQIQLCAQGLLLRANGYPSNFGYLYYRGNKKRVKIDFTDILIKATTFYIERAKQTKKAEMPLPLRNSTKCFRCSLNYICLPDETNYLLGLETNIRRIIPGRSDGGVLYVSDPGAKLGRSSESLTISFKDGNTEELPIKDLTHVSLFGNVQCSTQLIHTLMQMGLGISYLSTHGNLVGVTMPLTTKNVKLRQKQFIMFQHPEISLRLSRWIISAKISNQRTLLRRNGAAPQSVLKDLRNLREDALNADSQDSLRGIEGIAAKLYFESFPTMLKNFDVKGDCIMNGRNRRPPKDPVNALLSLGYTLLVRDIVAVCGGVGFDPLFGFYHSIEPGRPALALDLMEPFRPLIVDSVVLRTMNTQEISLSDFYWGQDSCYLKKNTRNKFFAAYERRMHEALSHPIFSYKISYRRTLEVEARMLARHLEGELPEYRPLTTR